jgi:hypothetical protein
VTCLEITACGTKLTCLRTRLNEQAAIDHFV